MNQQIVKFAARRVFEGSVRLRRISAGATRGRLVVFQSGPTIGSNLLWGPRLAVELRKLGWSVTVVPQHLDLVQRRRVVAAERADAILMIKGRHPLNRPGLYRGLPCVLILDDADYVLSLEREQVIECCRDSTVVLAGNQVVNKWVRQHNPNVETVWVSHPVPRNRPRVRNGARRPIVAWAHAMPWQYPVETQFVQDVMLRVARRRPVEFWLYGSRYRGEWDDYVRPIRDAGATVRVIPFRRSYRRYLASLGKVAVGLHPVCLENPFSHGKSFGKALSYMAADVAVVTHDVLDHSEFFCHEVNGMLPNDVDGYVESVDRLLADAALRQRLVDRCHDDFVAQLGTSVAAAKVDGVLGRILSQGGG